MFVCSVALPFWFLTSDSSCLIQLSNTFYVGATSQLDHCFLLADGSSFDVVVIGHFDTMKEVHQVWEWISDS
jgi:hypothetical protein